MTLEVTRSGYWFVELPEWEDVRKNRKPVVSHAVFDAKRQTGEMNFILTAQTPIHVGAGAFELAEDAGFARFDGVVKSIIKENGLPVIPGSSLKGAFRSNVEAMSYSCLLERRYGFQPCEVKDDKEAKKKVVCVACGLFGAMGFQGRVLIGKATLVNPNAYLENKPDKPIQLIALTQPRKTFKGRKVYPPIDYFSQEFWNGRETEQYYITAKRARRAGRSLQIDESYTNLTDFKAGKAVEPHDFIPAGTQLAFKVQFDNLTAAELGLILTGLGIDKGNQPSFYPRLGGAKPLCLGVVEVKLQDVTLRETKSRFTDFAPTTNDTSEPVNVGSWLNDKIDAMQHTTDMLFGKGLTQLTNLLQYPAEPPTAVEWHRMPNAFRE